MTTSDQDRTLNDLFDRPDVETLTCDQLGTPDLFVIDDETARLWRINPDGEYVTPNGLPVDGEFALVGGDWDFPAEFQTSETERVGGVTAVVTVQAVVPDNEDRRIVYFTFRREEDVQGMELVEFLGQLGRSYDDYRLRLTGAIPAWQS